MRKLTLLVLCVGLLVGGIALYRYGENNRYRPGQHTMISSELTGVYVYSYQTEAEKCALAFLKQLLPGDDTMNLEDIPGLAKLIQTGVKADRNEFVGIVRYVLTNNWQNVTVTLESRHIAGDFHLNQLVIQGMTHIPVRIPY